MRKKVLLLIAAMPLVSGCISLIGPEQTEISPETPAYTLRNEGKSTLKKECQSTYRVNGKSYCVLKHSKGFEQVGIASWYGPNFHGRKTASGEIYNMYKMTAAHKTLPLGTYVKVINLENGKTTIVRINDRGPFVPGRIIDLSYAAAEKLGILSKGTAKVKIIALGRKKDHHFVTENYQKGNFFIQLAAFKKYANAKAFRDRVRKAGINADIVMAYGLYRVVVGPELTYVKAEEQKDKIRKLFPNAFILTID
ncbi:septal ring lytic transglycosylase RlpA family protein [Desulfurobacterium sp.]